MTESIIKHIDRQTKRVRRLNTSQTEENVKQRLNQVKVSHVIYEGKEGDNLKEVRAKLKPRDGCILQIRGNKIYEIRAKIKKLDTVKQTIKATIQILQEKGLLKFVGTDEDVYKSVLNKFVGGVPQQKFTVKK